MKPAVAGELMLYSEGEKVFSTARLKMGSGTSGMLVTEVKKQMKAAAADAELAIIDVGDHRVNLGGFRVKVVGDAALLVEGRERDTESAEARVTKAKHGRTGANSIFCHQPPVLTRFRPVRDKFRIRPEGEFPKLVGKEKILVTLIRDAGSPYVLGAV